MYLQKKVNGLMLAVVLMTVLGACSAVPEPAPAANVAPQYVEFFVRPSITSEGTTKIIMGIQDLSESIQAGQFEMYFELREADGSQRARAEGELPPVDVDNLQEIVEVLSWESPLVPGEYEVTFGSQELGETRVVFTVQERDGLLMIGSLSGS